MAWPALPVTASGDSHGSDGHPRAGSGMPAPDPSRPRRPDYERGRLMIPRGRLL